MPWLKTKVKERIEDWIEIFIKYSDSHLQMKKFKDDEKANDNGWGRYGKTEIKAIGERWTNNSNIKELLNNK